MPKANQSPIRVLAVDDDANVLHAYRQVLTDSTPSADQVALRDLRARLFPAAHGRAPSPPRAPARTFDAVFCDGAEKAVAAVREACAQERSFAVAFLDMRMPPGPDGLWAAERIRAIDPQIDIAICTAYSDADPIEIGRRVPPADKLFYLQKPFHPHEVRQLALALGERRSALDQRFIQLADYDALTGLPNRSRFLARLKDAVTAAERDGKMLAVLHIDLDNFRRINDGLGLVVGDEFLRIVAQKLRETLRYDDDVARMTSSIASADNVARLGSDQFVVLLHAIEDRGDAAAVAGRLTRPLEMPTPLAHRNIAVTASIGIAIFPTDSRDEATLMRQASIAMHAAKRQGSGRVEFFEEAMHVGAQARLAIETQLRQALDRNEFSLQYQPQFDLGTGHISGMEALLRWNNPELGMVSPGEFIPVAEEMGLILPIGEWVLRTACAQAKTWQDRDLPANRVAVNVSCMQFRRPDFCDLVLQVLRDTGLAPDLLELEITESLMMADEAWTRRILSDLRRIGVSVAIDDFGIGYSSLGRLNELPVNRLKIDRSFVQGIDDTSRNSALVAAIVSMASAIGLDVVAEGVESFNQLLTLQGYNCQEVQGFLLSKPLTPEEATQLLEKLAAAPAASRTVRLRRLAG